MTVILFLGAVLIIQAVFINTVRRIFRFYRWTDVRYKQLMLLSGCIFSCTLAVNCFDDAQRIATAGTGFSDWFAIGALPAEAYHYAVLCLIAAMLPVDFVLFLYKTYHTETGSPDAGIFAETMIFTILPPTVAAAHYAAEAVLFILDSYKTEDLYGLQACLKAGLFLLSEVCLLYDAYSVRKCFDYTKLDIKKEGQGHLLIWGEKEQLHRKKRTGTDMPEWIRHAAEKLHRRSGRGR